MGDVGDYWREHKEHKAMVARRRSGITAADERKWERERIEQKKADHHARCTIKCECGKWFIDKSAHNCHKNHKGKAGHAVIETKENTYKEIDWSDVI